MQTEPYYNAFILSLHNLISQTRFTTQFGCFASTATSVLYLQSEISDARSDDCEYDYLCLWDVMSCSLIDSYQGFGRTCCLHLEALP
jgi:hypothetical protein